MKHNILLLLIVVILLTGCGKNKSMTCTLYTNDESQYTSTVEIEYKDDIVKNAIANMEFKNEKTADNMCSIFKATEDAKNNLTCKGTSITMKNYHKSVSKEKMKLNDFIKYLEDQNYECKK